MEPRERLKTIVPGVGAEERFPFSLQAPEPETPHAPEELPRIRTACLDDGPLRYPSANACITRSTPACQRNTKRGAGHGHLRRLHAAPGSSPEALVAMDRGQRGRGAGRTGTTLRGGEPGADSPGCPAGHPIRARPEAGRRANGANTRGRLVAANDVWEGQGDLTLQVRHEDSLLAHLAVPRGTAALPSTVRFPGGGTTDSIRPRRNVLPGVTTRTVSVAHPGVPMRSPPG